MNILSLKQKATLLCAILFSSFFTLGTVQAATNIQSVTSPDGLTAWLVEEQAIPMIALEIGFRAGASFDPVGKEGLTTLFAGMLEEGAGDLNAVGFEQAADKIAARFGFSSTKDGLRISVRMLSQNKDESIKLLKTVLMSPRFDAEPLARVKAQMESGIRQSEVDPKSIASKTFYQSFYPDDPYGRDSSGSLESVANLTTDDLHTAKDQYFNLNNIKIGVVGAITAEELGPMLDDLLGGLPNTSSETLPSISPASIDGIQVIKQDVPQSTVLFGHEGIPREDDDFLVAFVMNYMLGGGSFSSILTEEVREKRGLAYGVYSYLNPLDRSALYMGSVATANERVKESIELISEYWAKMAEEGVTKKRLDDAKTYLTGAYPLRFDSNAKIARYLVGAQLSDLPIDYIDTRNAEVEAVTLEDIKRVAKRILHAEKLLFVVVGDPDGLE